LAVELHRGKQDRKKLIYKRFNDFLKALDSSGRVSEMINQHHCLQQRKIWATKKLGDLWLHYPELQEILRVSSEVRSGCP